MKVIGNPNKCYYCGRDEYCTKDHFFAKSKINNPKKRNMVSTLYPDCRNILLYACSLCQRVKAHLFPHEFLKRISHDSRYDQAQKQRIKRAVTSLIENLKVNNEMPLLNPVSKELLLLKAMEVIDDFLNAGDKYARRKAAVKGKEVYKKFYGFEYRNRNERVL